MRYAKQAACLLLALALLAGCSGGEAGSSSPASRAGPSQSAAPPPAEVAAEKDPEMLRQLDWFGENSILEDGFYSFGGEVIPEKSQNDEVAYGYRLYYNDFATRQTQPLEIPGGESGYISDNPYSGRPFAFTTPEYLVVCYGNDGSVDALRLDLSDKRTLLESDSPLQPSYYSNRALYCMYYPEYIGEDSSGDTLIRLDIATGEQEEVYAFAASESPMGVYKGQLVLVEDEYRETDMILRTFFLLDLASGEKEKLYTVDEGGQTIYMAHLMEDWIVWHIEGESSLHIYDPATEERRLFQFPEEFNYFTPTGVWDKKSIVTALSLDDSKDFLVNWETGEIAPFPYSAENSDFSFRYLIRGSHKNFYIIRLDSAIGKIWAFDDSGVLSEQKSNPFEDPTSNILSNYFSDYIPQYALIAKEDYWQGKLDYIPFTLMV